MTALLKHINIRFLALAIACLAAPVQAQTLSRDKDEVHYVIKGGDTLIGLAQRYMVSKDAYRDVQQLNAITDPYRLQIGSTLVIPVGLLRFTALDASVISLNGRATFTRGRRVQSLAIGSKLREGDIVETLVDGIITLRLSNGSRMAIPSNARIRLVRMRSYALTQGTDTDVAVERGRTETAVTPLKDDRSRFRMRTPIAISAVRGTTFRIGYDGPDAASLTEVVEGKVTVNLAAGDAALLLPQGYGASADARGNLRQEALLPPPMFQPASANQISRDVMVALEPSAGAAAYHVQIARDPAFDEIIADARDTSTRFTLGSLPDGRYWARATAIAPSGLEGMPQVLAIERALESLRATDMGDARRTVRFEWALRDLGEVRFQLFDQSAQGKPIVDQPVASAREIFVAGLPKGTYTWRIGRIENAEGKPAENWTSFETLRIER
jgi:hypothetical protein